MNVISSHINRPQSILPMETDFTNRLFHYGSMLRVEHYWLMLQLTPLCAFKSWFRSNARCSVSILFAIHRAALVAMQPSTVTAKCDEVGQRKLIVVKVSHG